MTDPTPTPTAHLREALDTLRVTRQLATAVNAEVVELRQQFDARHAALLFEAQHRRQVCADAEQMVRELMLAHYQVTGEKKPLPGAEVVIKVTPTYDKAVALEWAKGSKLCLIPESLDADALAKIAKATPLPFVTFAEEPSVRIATDLDRALGTVGAPAAAGDVG